MTIRPASITWRGPSGYRVVLDEDFVSLHPSGNALEEFEIDALLALIGEAKKCRNAGTAPTPSVPNLPF